MVLSESSQLLFTAILSFPMETSLGRKGRYMEKTALASRVRGLAETASVGQGRKAVTINPFSLVIEDWEVRQKGSEMPGRSTCRKQLEPATTQRS